MRKPSDVSSYHRFWSPFGHRRWHGACLSDVGPPDEPPNLRPPHSPILLQTPPHHPFPLKALTHKAKDWPRGATDAWLTRVAGSAADSVLVSCAAALRAASAISCALRASSAVIAAQ